MTHEQMILQTQRRLHNYIEWKSICGGYKTVTFDEMKAIAKEIKEIGVETQSFNMRSEFKSLAVDGKVAYHIVQKKRVCYLVIYGSSPLYRAYRTDTLNPERSYSGKEALDLLETKYEELNNTRLQDDYGTYDNSIYNCIPKQLYYFNENIKTNIVYDHVSSADFSSHYPYCACGKLPDAHTAVVMPSRVEPTEEYPFAFYIKSGHFAEYKGVDTRKWLGSKYSSALFRSSVQVYQAGLTYNTWLPAEHDVTVLMKPAKKTLDSTFRYFYSLKSDNNASEEERAKAKAVMNATIGMFHQSRTTQNTLGHLAVVIIARANSRMFEIMEKLDKVHIPIMQVCVDGIIYRGKQDIGTQTKALGSLVQEFTDCHCRITGINTYLVKHNDTVIKFKHGSYDTWADGTYIKEKQPQRFSDLDLLRRDSTDIKEKLFR